MNRETGFLCEAVYDCHSAYDPRGARHWGVSSRRKLHMRAGRSRPRCCDVTGDIATSGKFPRRRVSPDQACSRCSLVFRPSRSSFFSIHYAMLTDVGPVELWATRQRRPSAAANPQGLVAACTSLYRIRGSSPLWTAALTPAEPHIRSPLQSG